MARIDTVTESNGPDRFNLNPNCAKHQAGVRTGMSDSCCCCSPCMYTRKNDSALPPENRLCCRCIPKMIVLTYEPTNSSPCCRSINIPVFPKFSVINNHDIVTYSGSILGYEVDVYLSNGPIGGDPYGYNYHCQWTISVPQLGVYEEIPIDHVKVSCLGVPAVSLFNVNGFENCSGTVSLANFTPSALPFHARYNVPPYEGESLTVPFPYGFTCPCGDSLPRVICITKKHNQIGMIRAPHLPWEIEWWREFTWIDKFTPTFVAAQNEWVLGAWYWDPGDGTFIQHLYLIQDLYGQCWLQPDFNAPAGTNGEGEYYQRVELSSCGCSLKILNVRPINDLNPPTKLNDPMPNDLVGIDYRGGRCSCWDYACGRRRCVPQYFCGFMFVNNTLYKNILFSWTQSSGCWTSIGGEDMNGYAMPFSLQVCLSRSHTGKCQLTFSYGDYIIPPVDINDLDLLLSATFEGTNYLGDSFISLNIVVSLDGTCKKLISCVTATPCNNACGSHPPILHLTLHGYSLPTDYPPPPVTGPCTTNITLFYFQTIVVVGGVNIVMGCQYVGWAIVSSQYTDLRTGLITRGNFLIKAELSLGTLKITRRKASAPTVILESYSAVLAESCDPYYGYKLTDMSLHNCFFGDEAITWHHWYAEITE